MTTREKYEAIRDAYGLTDYQVAKTAGIEKSTFYTWRQKGEENPKLTMNVANMLRLAAALRVTIEEIVGDQEEEG